MLLSTKPIFRNALFATLWLGLALLGGCGGGSSGSDSGDTQQKLYISLTDAEGDFTQYQVDVTSLLLHRPNGVTIETIPATTTVDFVQYIDVSEILTVASVPFGAYKSAEITLDFTQAALSVEDDQGNSIPATAVDDDGNPLGVVTLQLQINARQGQGFVISPGQIANLSVDFDLESSNQVVIDTASATATVTVNPVLIANTSVDDGKTRRVRGLLDSIDSTAGTFDIDVRPFYERDHSYGIITVHTDNETMYEIDGVMYDSTTGLAQLALLDPQSPVVVLGQYSHSERSFTADEVYAGSSVPWDDQDMLKGSVIARNGDTLSVLGATIERAAGHIHYNDAVTIQVDSGTTVARQGSSESVDISDISVGQDVTILGTLVDDVTFDATGDGHVRMNYSDVFGSVVTVSPLELNVLHINRRAIARYDFAGTGIDATNDADPAQYEIDSGRLRLNKVDAGDPIEVRGFPTPFGSAPLDFNARSIKDVSALPTHMFMGYGDAGSTTAVAALDETGLLLDAVSATGRHYLKQASVVSDVNELPSVPLIVPNDGRSLYVLSAGRGSDVFTDWDDFRSALQARLDAGDKVLFVTTRGQFDPVQLTLTGRHVVMRLSEEQAP